MHEVLLAFIYAVLWVTLMPERMENTEANLNKPWQVPVCSPGVYVLCYHQSSTCICNSVFRMCDVSYCACMGCANCCCIRLKKLARPTRRQQRINEQALSQDFHPTQGIAAAIGTPNFVVICVWAIENNAKWNLLMYLFSFNKCDNSVARNWPYVHMQQSTRSKANNYKKTLYSYDANHNCWLISVVLLLSLICSYCAARNWFWEKERQKDLSGHVNCTVRKETNT